MVKCKHSISVTCMHSHSAYIKYCKNSPCAILNTDMHHRVAFNHTFLYNTRAWYKIQFAPLAFAPRVLLRSKTTSPSLTWSLPNTSPLAMLNSREYAICPAAPVTSTRIGSAWNQTQSLQAWPSYEQRPSDLEWESCESAHKGLSEREFIRCISSNEWMRRWGNWCSTRRIIALVTSVCARDSNLDVNQTLQVFIHIN